MHIVLVNTYYNDGIVYYNLTFCMKKSLMIWDKSFLLNCRAKNYRANESKTKLV